MATVMRELRRSAGTARPQQSQFSVREARLIVGDCFQRDMRVFWADFLISLSIGYGCGAYYLNAPLSPLSLVAFFMSGFALFRVGSFIHEITHMGSGQHMAFKVAWNALAGIPMLMPSFLYDCHIDHHAVPHYGTHKDGEYLPLAHGPVTKIFAYLAQVLLIPILAAVRFLILTPVSFLHPRLRQWTLEHCTSYVINPWYRREIPANAPRTLWAWIEVGCFIRISTMLAVVPLGIFPWTRVLSIYLLAVFIIGLNWTRNLAAHHYRNEGERMSHVDQLEDSINIEGHPLWTELLFPLGLRYHALHHLFPGIPYHSLGRAHRKLMAQLPVDSPYRQTVSKSFVQAVRALWQEAQSEAQEQRALLARSA